VTKEAPDYTFEREDIGLREWLWRLVDERVETRIAAGESLQAMFMGLPSVHTDWANLEYFPDVAGQQRRFEQAVRSVVGGPDFDTADFVRKLVAFRLSLQREWRRQANKFAKRHAKRDDQFDRLADRLVERINAGAEENKERAWDRLMRLSAVYMCGPGDCQSGGSDAQSSASLAAHRVFNILGEELLSAPDALQVMLGDSDARHDALGAIARIGPPAVAFAPLFIDQIERLPQGTKDRDYPDSGVAGALGSIGRNDPATVEAIVRLLGAEYWSRRGTAVQTVEHLGTNVCGREAEIVALLEPMVARESAFGAALPALASVGRHFGPVRSRVMAMAAPRPPRQKIVSLASDLTYEYDEVMFERGVAISAMRYFGEYADECLPVLVEAMVSFEEFDPDETYNGPLERICHVLDAFGEMAAPVAGALASHLDDDPEQYPTSILRTLGELGPPAREALPRLIAFRATCDDAPLETLDKNLVAREDDLLDWAIQRLHGQQ
jgi:hypothetical protein